MRRPAVGLVLAALALALAAPAHAATLVYTTIADGAHSVPPTASPGIANIQLTVDTAVHTMRVQVDFTALQGVAVAAHVHAPTVVPFTGSANAATVTPTFTGFPTGVTSGTYDHTYDLALASSYNPEFLADYGGDTAVAESVLLQAVAESRGYFVMHTSAFPNGELRGWFAPVATPVVRSTWARLKALYR